MNLSTYEPINFSAQREMNLGRRADLHIHTLHSDGTFSPEEVVTRAKQAKLTAISITDHDTVAALPAACQAAGGELELIAGVELTAVFKERELHILGYFIRVADPSFQNFLTRMHAYRRQRIEKMVERLGEYAVKVDLKQVYALAGQGSVGRPHLAQALVQCGAVGSIEEAFERYIGDRAPCFVKGATLSVSGAVQVIQSVGGVAVLAHPHRLVEDAWIPSLVESGIQGIEVYHSDHDPQVAKHYERLAEAYGLCKSGGSDCHGLRKSKGPLLGSVTIPYEWVERLKAVATAPSPLSSPPSGGEGGVRG